MSLVLLLVFLGGSPALSGAGSGSGVEIVRLSPPTSRSAGFTPLDGIRTGVAFTNRVAESRSLTNHILLNGSGVAAGDVDGDGRCDLYFCAIDGPNGLYRNLGDWNFEEIAAKAGVDCPSLDATGAVLADLDGDGDLDLLVAAIRAGVSCFRNDGTGRFTEVTRESGLGSTLAAMTLALADIDGDGDLDLYVSNYRNETLRDGFRMQVRAGMVDGRRVITHVNDRALTEPGLEGWVTLDAEGNLSENGQVDQLFRNEGGLRFVPVPFTGGAFVDETGRRLEHPPYDWTLSAMFRDLDGDRRPDLYVCSDLASPDRIWLSRGDGGFRAAPATTVRKTSWFSMGVDFADLDRDGFDEIFVTDMLSREHRLRQVQIGDHRPTAPRVGGSDDRPQVPRNTLFWNQGDGGYLEAACFSGLEATDWSWAPVFLDVDLDGYEDLLVTTGFERDVQDVDIARELEALRQQRGLTDQGALRMRARFPRLALPDLAFRNRGNRTFEEVGTAWGFDHVGVSQGIALADLDGDGDLDVAVNRMNEPAGIFRNDAAAPRVAVRLAGARGNTRAIGARIRVLGAMPFVQSQEVQAGGRYLSGDEAVRVFAAGPPDRRIRIEVDWPWGSTTVVSNVPAGSMVRIAEPVSVAPAAAAVPLAAPINTPPPGLFEGRDAAIGHRHHERDFDDFARQRLLPRKLSQGGPAVAWADLDRDGWDDLLVGSGAGGMLAAFRNDRRGGFTAWGHRFTTNRTETDFTGIVTVAGPGGGMEVMVAQSNYEAATPMAAAVRSLPWGGMPPSLVGRSGSDVGPLALADFDGDGLLELFVGGRSVPGRYPAPADSQLLRRRDGRWVEEAGAAPLLRGVGLVSGAVFSDLEADGYAELVLACDWGPIRVFRNRAGRLSPWDPGLIWTPEARSGRFAGQPDAAPKTLGGLSGGWNGVSTGDFDGDGRLDLLASNWGRNLRQERYRDRPLGLHAGDFAGTGEWMAIESHWDPGLRKTVPWMHMGRFLEAMPALASRFPTFRQFGLAGVDEILGERRPGSLELQSVWLETTLFLQRTNGFEVRPLPDLAQWAPAFAVAIADFDGDGREDVFLSQNFFAMEPETGRLDGGRGLCLLGDGRGGFTPLDGRRSGLVIHGEQRAAAVADYDADGRPDLVVGQNGEATRLFRNRNGRPGLRVRLAGPVGNPDGVGAVVRLRFARGPGPAREIHAGSGYWSQDSPVPVLALPADPVALEVTWPGGRFQSILVPPGATEVRVAFGAP